MVQVGLKHNLQKYDVIAVLIRCLGPPLTTQIYVSLNPHWANLCVSFLVAGSNTANGLKSRNWDNGGLGLFGLGLPVCLSIKSKHVTYKSCYISFNNEKITSLDHQRCRGLTGGVPG